jgi:hypothetical protein
LHSDDDTDVSLAALASDAALSRLLRDTDDKVVSIAAALG